MCLMTVSLKVNKLVQETFRGAAMNIKVTNFHIVRTNRKD